MHTIAQHSIVESKVEGRVVLCLWQLCHESNCVALKARQTQRRLRFHSQNSFLVTVGTIIFTFTNHLYGHVFTTDLQGWLWHLSPGTVDQEEKDVTILVTVFLPTQVSPVPQMNVYKIACLLCSILYLGSLSEFSWSRYVTLLSGPHFFLSSVRWGQQYPSK